MEKDIHIGELICEKFEEERTKIKWFAQRLGYEPANVYKIFQKQHFDTELLMKISILLNYNFFIHYSDLFYLYKNSKIINKNLR